MSATRVTATIAAGTIQQLVNIPGKSVAKEHPSTYVVQDRSNQEELQRLQLQDSLLTTAMGGVLPEQPDALRFTRVLDIGCGPGGWLIALARAYPDCETLIGVDLSSRLVTYAPAPADGSCKGNTIYRRRFTARPPMDRASPAPADGSRLPRAR